MSKQERLISGRSHLGPGKSLDSLGGKANDTACKAGSGVAGRLGREALLAGLGVVALAQVVGKLVDDDRPDDRTPPGMMPVSVATRNGNGYRGMQMGREGFSGEGGC